MQSHFYMHSLEDLARGHASGIANWGGKTACETSPPRHTHPPTNPACSGSTSAKERLLPQFLVKHRQEMLLCCYHSSVSVMEFVPAALAALAVGEDSLKRPLRCASRHFLRLQAW